MPALFFPGSNYGNHDQRCTDYPNYGSIRNSASDLCSWPNPTKGRSATELSIVIKWGSRRMRPSSSD